MAIKSTQNKWSAQAELIMMGYTLTVENDVQAEYLISYILRTLGMKENGKKVLEKARQHTTGAEVKYISTSRLDDMVLITIPLETAEDRVNPKHKFNLLDPEGVFCYCYNTTCPDFSELGYSYFQKKDGRVWRIG